MNINLQLFLAATIMISSCDCNNKEINNSEIADENNDNDMPCDEV